MGIEAWLAGCLEKLAIQAAVQSLYGELDWCSFIPLSL